LLHVLRAKYDSLNGRCQLNGTDASSSRPGDASALKNSLTLAGCCLPPRDQLIPADMWPLLQEAVDQMDSAASCYSASGVRDHSDMVPMERGMQSQSSMANPAGQLSLRIAEAGDSDSLTVLGQQITTPVPVPPLSEPPSSRARAAELDLK